MCEGVNTCVCLLKCLDAQFSMSVSDEGFRRENSGNTPQLALGIMFRAFRLASNCEHAPRSSDWEGERKRERVNAVMNSITMTWKVCLDLSVQQGEEEDKRKRARQRQRQRKRDWGGGGEGAPQEAASGLKQVKAWVSKISHKKRSGATIPPSSPSLKVYETLIFLCIQRSVLNNGRGFTKNV